MTNTKAQHTPGPWSNSTLFSDNIVFNGNTEDYGFWKDEQFFPLTEAECQEAEANSLLRDAAPELLEALRNAIVVSYGAKGLRGECDDILWVKNARAAIAKATNNA